MKPRIQRSSAFTLLELVLVMAIITMLAAMLLPALSSARGQARRIQCVNHLHQLQLALSMYADEHEDEFPPRTHFATSWIFKLQPYYLESRVLKCPSDGWFDDRTYIINAFNDWFEKNLTAREFDQFKNWNWPHGMRPSAIPEPSETITFGEKMRGSFHVHMDFFQRNGNDMDELDHGKHSSGPPTSGGSNFAFADGSVRFLKFWGSVTPLNLWAVTKEYREWQFMGGDPP